MSNLNVNNTASSATSAIYNPAHYQQKSTSDFQSTLDKEIQVGEPCNLKIQMEDGTVVELKNCQRVIPGPITEASAEYKKAWAETEKMRQADAKAAAESGTPEGQKKYMMSKDVESVARDATGNIVAKLYKDGSFYCSNQLAGAIVWGDGRSHVQEMQQIEKQPNIVVTHYKNKVTDFDLLPEQMANDRKLHLRYPEFYRQYSKEILEGMALNERILAL